MKLFTNDQYYQLIHNGKPENRDKDHHPVIRLFLPETSCTWLISELDSDDDTAFGLCDLGMGFPELGYVSIAELSALRSPRFKLHVERDVRFEAHYPMSTYSAAARLQSAFTDNVTILSQCFAASHRKQHPKPSH